MPGFDLNKWEESRDMDHEYMMERKFDGLQKQVEILEKIVEDQTKAIGRQMIINEGLLQFIESIPLMESPERQNLQLALQVRLITGYKAA